MGEDRAPGDIDAATWFGSIFGIAFGIPLILGSGGAFASHDWIPGIVVLVLGCLLTGMGVCLIKSV